MYWRSDGSMWSLIFSLLHWREPAARLRRLLGRSRSGEQLLRPHQLARVNDYLIVGCQHLVNGGEVASAPAHHVADDAEDHAEPGPDQHRGTHERERVRVVREEEQDEPEEQAEPGAAGRP